MILNRTPGRRGLRGGGRDLPPLAGARACWPRTRSPRFYLLEQTFEAGGRTLARHGLFARFRAEDPERGVILPHEQTRKGPREDRYRAAQGHARQLQPHLPDVPGPAAGASRRRRPRGGRRPPLASYTDDGGVAHRLWRVAERRRGRRACSESLAGAKAYIADGHHRHATALRYRDEVGPEGAWTMGYFTPLEGPGLVVLPYHRILSRGAVAWRRPGARSRASSASTTPPRRRARPRDRVARSTAPYAFGLAEPGGGSARGRGAARGGAAPARRGARPACARSTPSSSTRPCCRRC